MNKYMKTLVNNVEYESSINKFIVARPVNCELWYYGRYATEERAKEVAKEINGIVVEDEIPTGKILAIKNIIDTTEEEIKNHKSEANFHYAIKDKAYDFIKEVVEGKYDK